MDKKIMYKKIDELLRLIEENEIISINKSTSEEERKIISIAKSKGLIEDRGNNVYELTGDGREVIEKGGYLKWKRSKKWNLDTEIIFATLFVAIIAGIIIPIIFKLM